MDQTQNKSLQLVPKIINF